jgi:nitrite reductase/ring-hydroxylating ferredoxin subunit
VPLRVFVCYLPEVVTSELRGFAVPGVTWPVMVTRLDGEVIAFPGVCPHDDVSLIDYGVLTHDHGVTELACRVHGYRFDLATGRCAHQPSLALRRYKVTLHDAEVWVDLL